MRSKLLSLMTFGILATLLLISLTSAAITFSTVPTLSQTGSSFNIDITSNQNETITFSGLDSITEGSEAITFTVPSDLVVFEGITQTVTINYNVQSGFDFEFGKIYSTDLEANGTVNSLESQELEFEVNDEACSVADNGNLDIRIRELDVESGFGEDNEWFPLDQIEVEIEVENNGGDDIDDIEIEWGLYNRDTGKWIVDDKESDFDLKDGKDETVLITFTLDEDVDEFSESDEYVFYAWATGEDTDNDDEDTCASDLENIEIIVERDFVVLSDITAPEIVSCGAEVQITADVWNVGEDDQDEVYVYVYNKELGLAEDVVIGDIDAFEDDQFTFDFIMPEDSVEKTYGIKLSVYDEDNDLYENDYDDDEANFNVIIKVEGSCSTGAEAAVSANLLSGGQAGKELVVKATITNTGDSLTTYSLSAADYTTWASLAQLDQSTIVLSAGSSQDVLITFDVNKDSIGEQLFDLEIVSGNEAVLTQPVSITITKAGWSITGLAVGGDNWYLWGIGFLNIILVIIIILVAVRVARK